MDWSTFSTAFIGALGGTGTALVVLGTLSKSLLDHGLKKDFKRFEAKLDALTSKKEVEFSYLHPERSKIAKDIYKACVQLEKEASELLNETFMPTTSSRKDVILEAIRESRQQLGQATAADKERDGSSRFPTLEDRKVNVIKQYNELIELVHVSSMYYDKSIIAPIQALADFATGLANGTVEVDMADWYRQRDTLDRKRQAVEEVFKKMLGVEATE